jgi:BirA family biotin operon repressor/biotin-[acetyl-CoA-carboxylase] ligase
LITTAAAVAVAEAIETVVGKCCGIKWVNDLILDGKKVCGILTEGAFRQDSHILDYAVLGIGVNVTVPEDDFHEEIRDIAGALAHEPVHNLRNRLVAEILQRFEGYYANLAQKAFLASYRKRLFFLGKTIRVLRGGLEFSATAVTLDEDLRLVVRYDDGREEALSSGEIAIKL